MIGYRFLSAAEEEITEASVFYHAASSGLGSDFLAVRAGQLRLLQQRTTLLRICEVVGHRFSIILPPFALHY